MSLESGPGEVTLGVAVPGRQTEATIPFHHAREPLPVKIESVPKRQ